MLPILIQFSFIKIYTIGVFLVLALFWGSFFLWKNIRLTAFKEDEVFDGLFFSLAGGAFFGRVLYVATHFEDFGFNIAKFLLFNGYPGFTLLGCIAGFIFSLFIFTQIKKMKFSELIDYTIPALFLSLAIGKVGSFFAGTEIGTKTTFPVAIKYASFDGLRHITPLYEAIVLFILTYITYKMMFSIRREVLGKGFLMMFFIWSFAAMYFVFDFIRGDKIMVYGYSAYGMLSLILLLTLSIYFVYYFRAGIGQLLFNKKSYGSQSSHTGVHPKSKGKATQGKN